MKEKLVKALMIEPYEHPRVVELKCDLDSLQKAVSIGAPEQGLIEFVYLEDNVCDVKKCSNDENCKYENRNIKPEGGVRTCKVLGIKSVVDEYRCGSTFKELLKATEINGKEHSFIVKYVDKSPDCNEEVSNRA